MNLGIWDFDNFDLMMDGLRFGSPQYQEELKEHDKSRQQWERTKTLNGKEWLTEWGAGLLLAEGLGHEGYDARHAADWSKLNEYECNGKLNQDIRKAVNDGDLKAIRETQQSAIKTGELGNHTRVLINKGEFVKWLIENFPTIEQSREKEANIPVTDFEPSLKSRDTEGQRKWIEYHVQKKGYLLKDFCNLPNGVKKDLKDMAGEKGIGGGVIDDRWKELRKIHQSP